jgi:hypothetical protein
MKKLIGDVAYWHVSDVTGLAIDVRFRGEKQTSRSTSR